MSEITINAQEQDPRLAAALEFSNYRITLNNQKKQAQLKYQNDLVYAENGGIFHIDRTLISFVHCLIESGKERAIILDKNEQPIEIKNLVEFKETILDKYYQFSNAYLVSIKELNQKRNVKSLTGV